MRSIIKHTYGKHCWSIIKTKISLDRKLEIFFFACYVNWAVRLSVHLGSISNLWWTGTTWIVAGLYFVLPQMATDISTSQASNVNGDDPISLKAVDDNRIRKDRMSQIFKDLETEAQDNVQLRVLMQRLEKLLTKELRTWCDPTTLKNDLAKEMIPRGLRIRI